MTNSRSKGKRGELEAAHELTRVLGVHARRGQQFAGGTDSPDVVTGLPGVHWEVKRVEALNLRSAMEQSISEAGGDVPVVLHRTNRSAWQVTVRLDDLPRLAGLIVARYDHGN